MQKHQYIGKTLDDALEQAAADLGTQKENVSYNILPSDDGGGLFKKLFSKSIKVEAWLEGKKDLQEAARQAVMEALEGGREKAKPSSRKSKSAPQKLEKKSTKKVPRKEKLEKQTQPQAPRRPRDRDEENPNAITFDEKGALPLLEDYTAAFLNVFGATLDDATMTRTDDGNMHVDVRNELLEDLLARSDRLSCAYEHIFKRIIQKQIGDLPQRLVLNAGEASQRRVDNLREMALSMAEKVKSTGRSITLNSKSGQERRIIHVTIEDIEGVGTRSIGTGENRKLVIYSLEKKRRRSGKGRKRKTEKAPNNESGVEGEGDLSFSQGAREGSAERRGDKPLPPKDHDGTASATKLDKVD